VYGYAIFSLAIAMAVACSAYAGVARARMWPIGEWLSSSASLPRIGAIITILWVVVKSYVVFSWWSPLIISTVGFSLAFALTFAMREKIQCVIVPGIFISFILAALYVSERLPFGFVSRLFE
jgi:hypothetical protein